nr:protein kinase, ATP binding site-containing protein [Tanacetum cinerariifolium]
MNLRVGSSESMILDQQNLRELDFFPGLRKADGHTTIVAKRWNSKSGSGDHQFWTELDILFNRKHENIIGLVGYCNEMNETIIVYKHASNGSLDKHLDNASLTWMKRLRICINITSGLVVLHGDSLHEHKEHTNDNAYGTFGNLDPVYAELGSLTTKSDIYSFGVIFFEILCGRLAWSEGCEDHSRSIVPLAKSSYKEGKIDEMVFRDIKQQIVPQSMTTFAKIAYECVSDDGFDRPEASEVVIRLKEALTLQIPLKPHNLILMVLDQSHVREKVPKYSSSLKASDAMKHEGIKKLKEVQQIPGSNLSTDQMQQWPTDLGETTIEYENNVGELFFLSEVNGKIHLMLSAEEVLHNSLELKLFHSKPSPESRPDIVHATCLCARYQAKTTEKHLKEVKRIFRYLWGTVNMGLWYMKDFGLELTGFSNADYAGCKSTFKSTSEYVSLSACCAQVLWMRTQLTDYGFHFNKIHIYCDSKSAIAISYNPVQQSRTKHISVRYHFIKEHVEKGTIERYFVKTDYQLADLFTKALPVDRFNYLVRRLDTLIDFSNGFMNLHGNTQRLTNCCLSMSYKAVKVRYIHSMIQPEPKGSTQEHSIR